MAAQQYNLVENLDKVANISVLLLVIVIAFQAAQISLKLVTPLPLGYKVKTTEKATMGEVPDIDALLAQNLFGEAGAVVEVEVEQVVDAPETKLNLFLQGVSASPDESRSSAIISESVSASGEIYWVGDSILGKAILSAVYEDRVMLKQGGRMETLSFSDEFKSSGGFSMESSGTETESAPMHNDVLRSYRARKESKDEMIRELGSALNEINDGNFEPFDSLLDEYGSNMEKNIDAAVRTAGLEATDDGMKVGSRAQENWINRVGLKHGDVVKSVNGYSVLTLKSDRSAIDSVIKSCVARIEVQRGANVFVVTYPFCN